ncbi:MAG: hypothetical protein EPO20_07520 [Betaproteobacteria bacterium]|nr:MAG: hypothetical protein EPO20_07520 [Betaproteobacteria bacterium]
MKPVELSNFFLLFFSAASVILLGAAYALLFALARLRNLPRLMPLAYASYAGLCASVLALAYAANLYSGGIWVALVIVMLIGYLLAPHAAFRLCKGMHAQTLGPLEKG